MRRSILLLIPLFGLTLLASPRVKAEQPEAGLFPGDALSEKVDVSARGETLDDLLRRLPPSGKPRLQAAEEARWERVAVFSKGHPLRETMAGLHTLLNYPWVQSRGAGGYILQPGIAARKYEQGLWQQVLERAAAPLFQLTGYLRLPASEYDRALRGLESQNRETDDPLLKGDNIHFLTQPRARAALELLTTLTPQQRLTLLSDERLVLMPAALNGRQRELAEVLAKSIIETRLHVRPHPGEKPDDVYRWLNDAGLVLRVHSHPVTGAITSYTFGAGGAESYAGVFPAARPDLELLSVRGNPYEPNARPKAGLYTGLDAKPFPAAFKLESSKRYLWPEVLEKLSQVVNMPIFSDDFTASPTPADRGGQWLPELKKLTLSQGLDALCAHYHRLWWVDGGALLFRSRSWFVEREYEVPPPVLASLRKQLEARGQLDVASLDMLARLTPRQLVGLNAVAAVDDGAAAGSGADPRAYTVRLGRLDARRAHSFLQVYAALSGGQRQQVLTAKGLPLAQMNPQQQERFLRMLAVEYGKDMLSDLNVLRLKTEQTVAGSTTQKSRLVANLRFSSRDRRTNEAPVDERLSITFKMD